MIAFGFSHKRKLIHLFFLVLVGIVFTANVLDLRDELRLISCQHSNWVQNITTGIQSCFSFDPAPILNFCTLIQDASFVITFLYISPVQNRAPPSLPH